MSNRQKAAALPLNESAIWRSPVIRRLRMNTTNVYRKRRFFLVIPSFVIFALITILSRNVHDSFLLEESIKETVLVEARHGGPEFEEIETLDQIWEWLEKTWIPYFYEDTNYDGTPLTGVSENSVLGINKIVNGFRLIQRRVREGTCDESPRFGEFVPKCWGELSDENEQTDTFRPEGHEEAISFEFQEEGHGVKGYFVDFGLDKTEAEELLAELKRDRFIDLGTRDIALDFTLYNHNVNQILVGRIDFRITATTLVTVKDELNSLRLEPYSTGLDRFRLALEIIFLAITFFSFLWEVYRIVRRLRLGKPVISWWFGWPLIRMVNIALSVTSLGLWYRYVNDELRTDSELPSADGKFHDFEPLALELQEYLVVSAVNILFFIVVTLEAVRFSDKASFITEVFTRSANKLFSFLVLFIFVYCSFALSGLMLFGVSLERWSSFGRAFTTLFEITTGEQGFEELREANEAAPVFYYLYVVLVFFLLFNVFVAILADGYIDLSAEKRNDAVATNKYTPFDFVREYRRNLSREEPIFDSAKATELLQDSSFREFEEVSYTHAMRVAKVRGFTPALVNQIFRRYAHGQVDLIKRSRRAMEIDSAQAAVREEFEAVLASGTTKFDGLEMRKLKERVLKRVDGVDEENTATGDASISDGSVLTRGSPVDFDSSDGSSYYSD